VAAGLLPFIAITWPEQRARAEPGEILTGLVISSDEVGLDGAVVALEGIGTANSDVTGGFAFRDVPPGNYRLTVNKEGFPTETRSILVQTGRLNKVRIVLRGPAPPTPARPVIGVPITRQASAILVRGHVNDLVETLLLVDTGATYCVLSRGTAERVGLVSNPATGSVRVQTASGSIEAPLVLVELIRVGGAEARRVEALIHDVPGLPHEVGGILGLSFLKRFTVEIVPAQEMMYLRQ
jgi:clan AA aspartic protease (TIGR02281 family)